MIVCRRTNSGIILTFVGIVQISKESHPILTFVQLDWGQGAAFIKTLFIQGKEVHDWILFPKKEKSPCTKTKDRTARTRLLNRGKLEGRSSFDLLLGTRCVR